jgi:glucose-1-phosphate cytidylyltransferase
VIHEQGAAGVALRNGMKVVILCGGLGTRLAEETEVLPKPMVEIGGHPIMWHIMKHYSHFGFKEFSIALGYKGDVIKRYFIDYCSMSAVMTLRLATGEVRTHERENEDWIVNLTDTGLTTMTGGRVRRLRAQLESSPFMLTYGDGVSDVDLSALLEFHRSQGRLATVTAVRPPARFGGIVLDGDRVIEFTEKPQIGEGWINGGYMIFEPRVFDYLKSDESVLEIDVLERLAAEGQLAAYRHHGFWQCMDTLRDKRLLDRHWKSGAAPWRLWQ